MNRKGFTLIELVMILVLIGIMAAVVIPRLGNVTSIKAAAFEDKLRADVRYAQNLAMTRNTRTRVSFTVTSYAVVTSTNSTCTTFVPAANPAAGGPFTVSLNTGDYTGITLTPPAMNCLEYDSLGRPYDCTGLGNVCATTPSGMTVMINPSGSVVITAQTGAVN